MTVDEVERVKEEEIFKEVGRLGTSKLAIKTRRRASVIDDW